MSDYVYGTKIRRICDVYMASVEVTSRWKKLIDDSMYYLILVLKTCT